MRTRSGGPRNARRHRVLVVVSAVITIVLAACGSSAATTQPTLSSQAAIASPSAQPSPVPSIAVAAATPTQPPDATAIAGAPESGVTLKLVANADTWSVTTLTAPAGKVWHVEIKARNGTGTISHNFVVFASESAPSPVFRSPFFSGTTTHTYEIPALPPGQYLFTCQIHAPKMSGTLIVR